MTPEQYAQTPVREALSKSVITAFWLGYFQEGFRRDVFEGLLNLFEEGNMIKKDIAKRLNKKPEQITRWLAGPSNIESDTISDLALSMGYIPKITFEPLDRENEIRPPDPLTTPEAVILAWANSGGFAATHDQGATPEAIADDMLRFLQTVGWKLVRK